MREICTKRLRLRHMKLEDAEFIVNCYNEPEGQAMAGETEDFKAEEILLWIESLLNVPNMRYVFETKNGELIGFGGLCKSERAPGSYELGYVFTKSAWGKGYATEAASAIIKTAYEQYGIQNFSAFTADGNTASQNVLRKLGFVNTELIVSLKEKNPDMFTKHWTLRKE